MDVLDVCRLCLKVSSENMENLFEDKDIWTKISPTLKEKLQQQSYLPNGICYSCKAITTHLYSFYQKVIDSQNILHQKLIEGAHSLQEFLYTLKSVKVENVEHYDVEHISNKTDDINDDLAKEDDLAAKTFYNTVSVKFETDFEIQYEIEDLKSLRTEQNAIDDRKNCFDNVLKNESDFYEGSTQDSDSDVSDWKPQSKYKREVKLCKQIKNDTKDNNISECNDTNDRHSKLSKIKNIEGTVANPENPELEKNADEIDVNNKMEEPRIDYGIFKCLTCFEVFPRRKLLAAHFASKHKPEIAVSPEINVKNFTKLKKNGEILCKCGYCGKLFKSRNIKEHMICVHNKIRPYVCKICGKTYKHISAIIDHNRAHNGLSLFCSYNCGYSSSYSSTIKQHEMGKHRGEFRFKCECGKGFDAKTSFEDHQNKHKGVKPYVCCICRQAYHYEKHLRAHSRSAHLIRKETDEKSNKESRLLCTLCSEPCGDMPGLKDHLFKKHGVKKKYLCEICGKACNSSSHLHGHKREVHSDEKPYSCSQCDWSFKTRPKLTRHQRSHTNERPFPCPYCPKRFTRPEGLKNHLLICYCKPKDRTEAMETS